jgi:hypothetical protein
VGALALESGTSTELLVGSSAAGFFRQVAGSSVEVENDNHDIGGTALKCGVRTELIGSPFPLRHR